MDWVVVMLLLSLNTAVPATAAAADDAKATTAPAGKDDRATAPKSAPGKAPGDPLAHLKPHEERRYRIDMQDCAKEKAADRRLCERSVQSRAAARSRRRGAAGL